MATRLAGLEPAVPTIMFTAHTRDVDDWDSAVSEVFNSGFSDHGFLGRIEHEAGPRREHLFEVETRSIRGVCWLCGCMRRWKG